MPSTHPAAPAIAGLPTTYLILSCKLGLVQRDERRGVRDAFDLARHFRANGFAVTVLPPRSWAARGSR